MACVLRVPWTGHASRNTALQEFSSFWSGVQDAVPCKRSIDYPLYEAGFERLAQALPWALRVPKRWAELSVQKDFQVCTQCRVAVGFGAIDGRNGGAFANVWPLLCAPYSGVLLSAEAVYCQVPPSGIGWHEAPQAVQQMVGGVAYMPTDYREHECT